MPLTGQFSYDAVPYTSLPYHHSHPDNICTIGRLFGMNPAFPTECRVLEIGCASGGNLLPMAEQLRESEFSGIDLSKRQVEEGRENIRALGLGNLVLDYGDICDEQFVRGSYDYIICHGVYSWVSREVQDRILSVCRDHLSPHGIAYVSFNTYPGWHLRESARQMMRYHSARYDTPRKRVAASRELLDFLVSQLRGSEDPYALMLRRELGILRDRSDDYLFHEHLERYNAPCYFHQFAAEIERFSLQYLGDAELSSMLGFGMSDETLNTINRITTDIIQMEQYLDFVRNRQFRMALICHDTVPLKRKLDSESALKLRFLLKPSATCSPADIASDAEHCFETGSDRIIRTGIPLMKAGIGCLMEKWPCSVTLDELYRQVKKKMDAAGVSLLPETETKNDLVAALLQITGPGGVSLRSWEPPVTDQAGERPRIRPSSIVTVRRYSFATNAHHELIQLAPAVIQLALLLDGKKNRTELIKEMIGLADKGIISITMDGVPLDDPQVREDAVTQMVDNTLENFAGSLLLVPEESGGC